MITRTASSLRPVWLAVLAITLLPGAAFSASLEMLTTGGCACCHAWARHLREAGHEVAVKELAMGQLIKMKLDAGIPTALMACHTARVEGYLIEGHVPEREVRRLLDERPKALGLVVPGMPVGSPGMEAGNKREPYEVLLLKKDGSTEIFARYDAQSE
ncbi:MAG: DUF411 domain-containing protein [Hyphomicrobium sp.]|nr:DUF411 domain-containing protein [Hyphomicrobium sp.]